MALELRQMRHRATGEPLRGFTVVNKRGKVLALGATGNFVLLHAPRYARDKTLVAKVVKLTGLEPRG
jgi:hypothetical protein